MSRVRKFDKRNEQYGFAKNRKMNDDTYVLRRKVIDLIYEAKKRVSLPRIEVRITENHSGSHSNVLGLAYLNQNVIYIPNRLVEKGRFTNHFREVVLHEIVHAVTGFRHDPKCPLMSPSVAQKPMTEAKMWETFEKYFK
jgi:hypothetical protein